MSKLRVFYPASLINKDTNELNSLRDYQIEASGSIIEYNIFDSLSESLKDKILFNEIYPEVVYDTLSSSIFLSCILILKKDSKINAEEVKNEVVSILESEILKNKFLDNELFLASDSFYVNINKNQKELITMRND